MFIFSIWAPLAMVASWLVAHGLSGLVDAASPDEVARWIASAPPSARTRFWILVVFPPAAAFALASALGGALVGRFGSGTRDTHAVLAGLIAGSAAWALAAGRTGLLSSVGTLFLLGAVGALFGWLGFRRGRPKL